MRRQQDSGMTLLEVSLALVIFLIGIGFVVSSNSVSYRYRNMHEQRQQMLFYAAGQIEALVEGQPATADHAPFNGYAVETTVTEVNPHLEQIQITVSIPSAAYPPEPVTMYTYRVKP